jgi:hypothetical protein
MKVKLGLPNHVIAAQAGWSEKSVEKMVETYAHSEVGALDAIDTAWGTVPDANSAVTLDALPGQRVVDAGFAGL